MKIAFYINAIHEGGAERVMVNLASRFANDGDDVILITSFKDTWEYSYSNKVKRYSLEEEEIKRSKIKRNFFRIMELRKVLKLESPDCIVSFMAEPNYRAILATKGLGIKTIISVRNDPNKEYHGKVGHFLAKYLLVYADGCVFQTNQAKEWFPKKLQNKSRIIFNAVSEIFYSVENKPVNKNVVACGRLEPQKNYHLLLNAFAGVSNRIPEAKLLIYGVGSQKDELQQLVEKLDIKEKVSFMGMTDNVDKVLSEASLFVLSSDYEGMPNALMEALTAGVPCISTDCPCGGPQMLIEHEKTGLLVPINDQEQMTLAMEKMLLDDTFARNIGKNAKAASVEYHPNKVMAEWKAYIEDVCNGL